MFNSSVPYSVPVAPIGGNSGFGGGMFGGDGLWGLIIILALLGGFGNGGFVALVEVEVM
jgi:predicted lipid-binding transport protein (Tim44 family)